MARARTPRFFKNGDGRFPITFEPDRHPLGRGARVHLDRRCSRVYRIDSKGRVRQQEYARPTRRATVTYAELMPACPGRVLPTRVQMLEWDVTAQAVVGIADIEDTYERDQHVWLPMSHRAAVGRGEDRRDIRVELSRPVAL
jgi:broad specificity phosphatase PhoE